MRPVAPSALARLRHPRRSARHPRRGAAAVEFALTLPILVLLLLGTIEFGNYFSQLAMVNVAARDGARFGGAQRDPAQAQVQAALAARTLLEDMYFPCELSSSDCRVQAQAYQLDGNITLIELEIDLTYRQLTGAVPAVGFTALPTHLRARAVYPLVGE